MATNPGARAGLALCTRGWLCGGAGREEAALEAGPGNQGWKEGWTLEPVGPAREPRREIRAMDKLQFSAQPRYPTQSPGLGHQCPGRSFSLNDPSFSAKTFDQSLLASIPKSLPALAPGRSQSLWWQCVYKCHFPEGV